MKKIMRVLKKGESEPVQALCGYCDICGWGDRGTTEYKRGNRKVRDICPRHKPDEIDRWFANGCVSWRNRASQQVAQDDLGSVNRALIKRLVVGQVPSAAALKALRNALGMTVANCAEVVHVNKSAWSRWESFDPNYAVAMPMMAWDLFMHKTVAVRKALMERIRSLERRLKKGVR